MADQFDLEGIRARLPMAEVCTREGVEFKKSGAWLVARCPFHEEKSGSFQIGSQRPDRAVCRGCGWHGDIFEFWMRLKGVSFKEAVEQLASLCGLTPSLQGVRWTTRRRKVPEVTEKSMEPRKPPALPRMRALTEEEIVALAKLRGLQAQGVAAAAADKRVGFATWPQYERCAVHGWHCRHDRTDCVGDGVWHALRTAAASWVVTDRSRNVAQFRRMDGAGYARASEKGKVKSEKGDEVEKDKGIKSWTKGSPTWPIGAAEIGEKRWVILVEGGADMLAAYHFLWGFKMLEVVAVVCMLGGTNRIGEDALPFFEGCRVRIFPDEDEPRKAPQMEGGLVVPGHESAARWTEQLQRAGAAVDTPSLAGLMRHDGKRVKDLNDLALCNGGVVGSDQVMDWFHDWDF